MKIGVTGGAGFIGSNLARTLTQHGYSVVIFDNLISGKLSNLEQIKCEFIHGDLIDRVRVAEFVSKVDWVVHLGALGSVPRSIENPTNSFNSNVLGTLNVLEEIRKHKVPIIFSSSSSVYGKNETSPKKELDWLLPLSPYASTKLSCESLILSYANTYNLNALVFRLFNVFGPYQRGDHPYAAVIPKWSYSAIRGERIIVYGDGNQSRDFTYVDTVTDTIRQSIDLGIFSDKPVNLAAGKSISLNYVLAKFKEYYGALEIDFQPQRPGDIRNSLSDPSELRKLFPEFYSIDFDRALQRTLEWLTRFYKN